MSGLSQIVKKAPLGAFFVFSLFCCQIWADCRLAESQNAQAVQIQQVVDGDTVRLEDGRKVRVLGINTPEMGPGKLAQPLAEAGRAALQALLKPNPVYLVAGEDSHDRYGRVLGHLYDRQGNNITAALLEQGWGFQVAIPPNLAHEPCYRAAQQRARLARAGVWGHHYYRAKPASSTELAGGYGRITGTVESVSLSKKSIWVELEGQVTLKLEKRYARHLAGPLLDKVVALSRQVGPFEVQIEAQGWLSDRLTWHGTMPDRVKNGQAKRFQMKIQHNSAWSSASIP